MYHTLNQMHVSKLGLEQLAAHMPYAGLLLS